MASLAHLKFNIIALSKEGRLKEALQILLTTHNPCVDSSIYLHLLQICIAKNALPEGKQIHSLINGSQFKPAKYAFLQNKLINMYDKCGSVEDARNVFNKMEQPNKFSWNMIIASHRSHGFPQEAINLFYQMQRTAVHPDQFTFSTILSVCADMASLKHGSQIHGKVIRCRFQSDIIVVNSLIDMHLKCGSVVKARELFDKMPQRDTVSWNVIMTGYAQNGRLDEASRLFKEMPQRNVASWNGLITGYAKDGLLHEALRLLREIPQPNVVSWNAVIVGYARSGPAEKALEMIREMQLAGLNSDSTTFISILPACAKLGALEQGMEVHRKIIENGFLSDAVATAMIDMYAKCGNIQKAHALFDKMKHPDVTSWTAIISGYAMDGSSKDALKLFELMRHSGTNPDDVSFLCVLFACSHSGLVDEGCTYFNSMTDSYCIMPALDHYTCMIDLLSRAGYLEEALNFVIKMPIKPDLVVWMSLLGACRSHKNIGFGEFVATILIDLEPQTSAPFVLLSNIYAEVGRWGDVRKVRNLMKARGIRKIPGCSWTEAQKLVHV
ncbi:pentatricopeptide repeat-containing protein At2g13600 [Cryptomeria japonica]|uniref:pentatricopeptide repeat-containing protein At2g13600 n=1 Tax=Cryptomeria japonica TaxID=3369 RepID=UPI0027DA5178|nr:pentatricopeptide repeat-containing protein At2g13600 [Cryptomeria japonica]XP_059069631.1 pentatricopeptide repeat-containing protein At2g13600 [Cryptomeria japonica]XP_059069632.1 pentatricopeptide repeat-containing protein At2g13600 [Cryptomeria japonica]